MTHPTNLALVDDHVLLRRGLATLISSFENCNIIFESDNGRHLTEKIRAGFMPDVVLLDINMPEMDGYETCLWLKNNFPLIKVLALSMYDSESSVIRMFKAGAKGYILKDCDPSELKVALNSVISKGFYYSELVTGTLIHSINTLDDEDNDIREIIQLSERYITFLKYVCTELTYKEIAEKMYLSPRTIDGYRDDLFEKLNVKTRVGLAMYAIKNGIVSL